MRGDWCAVSRQMESAVKIAVHSSCAQSGTSDGNCIMLTALGTMVGSKGPGGKCPL